MPLTAGTRLGPYEVLAAIGAGGMGEVYRARDIRLGRQVAIKVSAEKFNKRFEGEARAIAALNHPNICALYDVGENYLVMELVHGERLKGPLPLDTAVNYARQIADALEAAHQKGIIHRDLKPDNILVANSIVKLLDFGLAKIVHAPEASDETVTQTQAGTILGSAAYMSPEQAEGKPVDARTDIFSFGVVLYELINGRRPFQGKTAISTMAAILREEPQPLDAPEDFSRFVMRCLRKSPTDRWQTMAELKSALRGISLVPHEPQPSIAVLPFTDMSSGKDSEYFGDGLAEEIINALSRIPNLKVIARTSAFAFKGKQEDIRKIAEALGVTNVLEGSVRLAGNRVRITAQLITAADGSHVWSERYDREMSDIFAIQDEISQAIADALKAELDPRTRSASGPPLPVNMEAYHAYLEGNHYMAEMTASGMLRSLECYERSICLDPKYAAPLAAIGERAIYLALYVGSRPREVVPSGLAAANRALELNPKAAEAYFVRGMFRGLYEWNWSAAGEDLGRAIDLNPAYALAHAGRSHILLSQRRNDEAAIEIRRALDLDPLNILTRRAELLVLNVTGNGELAVTRARALVDLFSGSWVSWAMAARALTQHGLHDEAEAALRKGLDLSPQNVIMLAWLAMVRGRLGRSADAERIRAEMEELTAHQYVPFWLRSVASEGCGDMAQSYRYIGQALDERELNGPLWMIGRRAELESDPRFQVLLSRINLA
jgi:serine/threonine protein kinase/tetratricopeptide (TPR) repeat protein